MSTEQHDDDSNGQQQQQPGTALTTQVVNDEQTALDQWRDARLPMVTSIDTNTDEGMQLALRGIGAADLKGKECVKRPIQVVNWLVHHVDPITSDDGSIGSTMRLVFITKDGQTIATRARAVLDKWRLAVSAAKLLKWKWPLTITLRLVPLDKTRSYLEIESIQPAKR